MAATTMPEGLVRGRSREEVEEEGKEVGWGGMEVEWGMRTKMETKMEMEKDVPPY